MSGSQQDIIAKLKREYARDTLVLFENLLLRIDNIERAIDDLKLKYSMLYLDQ